MNEEKARQLITKLVNAAYEAGMHSTNPDSLFVKFWKDRAEGMVDGLVRHLSSKSSGRDKPCQHPLSSFKPVRVCHICGENLDARR